MDMFYGKNFASIFTYTTNFSPFKPNRSLKPHHLSKSNSLFNMSHQRNQLSEEEAIFIEFLLASDNPDQRNFDIEVINAEINRELFTEMTDNANSALEKIIQVAAHPECEAVTAVHPLLRTLITKLTEVARKCEAIKQYMEDKSIQAWDNSIAVELEDQAQQHII